MWKKKGIIIISFLVTLNITAQKFKKDVYLDSLAKKIQFKYKELSFREGSLDAIKKIANYIKKNGNYYSVESNTSNEGKTKNNRILTDKRAEMVKKLLIKLGINPLKINSIGFGKDSPIGVHINPEENRRIEFTIIDKEKMKFLKEVKK